MPRSIRKKTGSANKSSERKALNNSIDNMNSILVNGLRQGADQQKKEREAAWKLVKKHCNSDVQKAIVKCVDKVGVAKVDFAVMTQVLNAIKKENVNEITDQKLNKAITKQIKGRKTRVKAADTKSNEGSSDPLVYVTPDAPKNQQASTSKPEKKKTSTPKKSKSRWELQRTSKRKSSRRRSASSKTKQKTAQANAPELEPSVSIPVSEASSVSSTKSVRSAKREPKAQQIAMAEAPAADATSAVQASSSPRANGTPSTKKRRTRKTVRNRYQRPSGNKSNRAKLAATSTGTTVSPQESNARVASAPVPQTPIAESASQKANVQSAVSNPDWFDTVDLPKIDADATEVVQAGPPPDHSSASRLGPPPAAAHPNSFTVRAAQSGTPAASLQSVDPIHEFNDAFLMLFNSKQQIVTGPQASALRQLWDAVKQKHGSSSEFNQGNFGPNVDALLQQDPIDLLALQVPVFRLHYSITQPQTSFTQAATASYHNANPPQAQVPPVANPGNAAGPQAVPQPGPNPTPANSVPPFVAGATPGSTGSGNTPPAGVQTTGAAAPTQQAGSAQPSVASPSQALQAIIDRCNQVNKQGKALDANDQQVVQRKLHEVQQALSHPLINKQIAKMQADLANGSPDGSHPGVVSKSAAVLQEQINAMPDANTTSSFQQTAEYMNSLAVELGVGNQDHAYQGHKLGSMVIGIASRSKKFKKAMAGLGSTDAKKAHESRLAVEDAICAALDRVVAEANVPKRIKDEYKQYKVHILGNSRYRGMGGRADFVGNLFPTILKEPGGWTPGNMEKALEKAMNQYRNSRENMRNVKSGKKGAQAIMRELVGNGGANLNSGKRFERGRTVGPIEFLAQRKGFLSEAIRLGVRGEVKFYGKNGLPWVEKDPKCQAMQKIMETYRTVALPTSKGVSSDTLVRMLKHPSLDGSEQKMFLKIASGADVVGKATPDVTQDHMKCQGRVWVNDDNQAYLVSQGQCFQVSAADLAGMERGFNPTQGSWQQYVDDYVSDNNLSADSSVDIGVAKQQMDELKTAYQNVMQPKVDPHGAAKSRHRSSAGNGATMPKGSVQQSQQGSQRLATAAQQAGLNSTNSAKPTYPIQGQI